MGEEITIKYPMISLENLEKEGKICFLKGQGISKKDFDDNGKNSCIHYGDLYTQYVTPIITKVVHKTNITGKVLSKYGDVLIPGTTTADAMGIAIARALDEDGIILGGDINIIRTNNSYLLAKFLAFVLSYTLKTELASHAKGTNILHLYSKDIKKIKVPVPSLEKQKEFIKLFEDASYKIDCMKANTKFTLSATKHLFENLLNDETKLLYSNSPIKKLSEVCDVRDGTHDSPKYLTSGGHPFVTSKNLKNDRIDMEKITFISDVDFNKINERSKVDIGDVLFAMIGTIGNPVVITEEPNFAIKNVALFKNINKIEPNYLKFLLKSPLILNKMQEEANGTTQKFVALKYLRNFSIPVPENKVQTTFVSKFDKISKIIRELELVYNQKLKLLEELKQSILKQAFAGES